MKKWTLLLAIILTGSISAFASEVKFSKEQISKAGIATVMSKDPGIIKIDKVSKDIVYLSYLRPSDGKHWAYRCKVEGNRIIWASDTGRWRDHKEDSVLTYTIDGDKITIVDRFSDGSASTEIYTHKQLK